MKWFAVLTLAFPLLCAAPALAQDYWEYDAWEDGWTHHFPEAGVQYQYDDGLEDIEEQEYEWSPEQGYNEEEWYDPSDWFDEQGVEYEYGYSSADDDDDGYDMDDSPWDYDSDDDGDDDDDDGMFYDDYGDCYYTEDWHRGW